MFDKTNYTVKAGKHKARGINWGINWKNKHISWTFKPNETWWYSKDKVKHHGKNKICGITFGLFPKIKKWDSKYSRAFKLPFNLCYIKAMHWNSLRIATQPEFGILNKINLYYYQYKEGIREYKIIDSFYCEGQKVDVSFNCEFRIWTISINGGRINFHFLNKSQLGYFLFPYFGGRSTLFKDWIVYLKRT